MKAKILKRIRRKTRILILETDGFHRYIVYVNGKYEESWADLSKAINYAWLEITTRGLTDKEYSKLEYRRKRCKIVKQGKLVYEN
jgi:hypothetical protein